MLLEEAEHIHRMIQVNKEYIDWIDSHPKCIKLSPTREDISVETRPAWVRTLRRLESYLGELEL